MDLPDFDLLQRLPWLRDVSVWSSPPEERAPEERPADIRDSFLLGGGGHLSARLGTRDRVSTMERIMAPYLSSYNFAENVNFRMSAVTPSRDFYPPFTFTPSRQHVWRVRNTGFVITLERDDTYELVTVNAVHPVRQVFLRYASLTNISRETIRNIGLSFEAPPDIPYPIAGHRSAIFPLKDDELSERVEELTPIGRDYSQEYSNVPQRYRFMVRGLLRGDGEAHGDARGASRDATAKVRGYQDLFAHWAAIAPGESVTAVQYLAPGLDDTEDSAIDAAQLIRHHIEVTSIEETFREIRDWWMHKLEGQAQIEGSERPNGAPRTNGAPKTFVELLENNAVLQHSVERATGGYVVIDDYTGSWLRDHNGPHLYMLDLGRHEEVRRSMDRYYALDRTYSALYSYYASDTEPAHGKPPGYLPPEPDWERVEGFVAGDVPNFRTLWYWWYFQHTGDLELVRQRFHYLKGAFLRQKLHDTGFLAGYCYDETYGIGPVGPMRTGISADNSFNALSAARKLAHFARLLERDDAEWLAAYASRIQEAIEETFWLENEGYYAMRVKPDGVRDTTPFSIGLLRPLWVGIGDEGSIGDGSIGGGSIGVGSIGVGSMGGRPEPRAPSPESRAPGDHAIRSALYAYEHLYHDNGFLRLIPSHDQTVTMAIGYMLNALKKIGHPDMKRVLCDLLKWADPSGTFGEYLDERPDGPWQCYEHMAHRNRTWESGINADAVFQALTGFQPNAYVNAVAFEPYLPPGWREFNVRRMRVGENYLSLLQCREEGEREQGEREQGEREQGEREQGEREQGEREQGERDVASVKVVHEGGLRNNAAPRTSGAPLDVTLTLTLENNESGRSVAGVPEEPVWHTNRFGVRRAEIRFTLEPGTSRELVIA